jgi:adenosine deaminase
MSEMHDFIIGLPKAELHLHIEGSFEPELMFQIATRNKIELKYKTIDELKQAYQFSNLQDFLDIYYEGAAALIHEQDFYDLTWAYLTKVHGQNVQHIEIFFDPQTHTDRGIAFSTVINGITKALDDAKTQLGMSSKLIMSFLRHLDEASAQRTLDEGLKYKDRIIGVGLDSSELGNPPSKFERVFTQARQEGFLSLAHAGEEGPPAYIWEALHLLKVDRIDHGNRCLEDETLVAELIRRNMALTVCPLSNLYLKVVTDMKKHPIKKMLNQGLFVTVNSDDPAYFGGYMNENFIAIADALDLTKEEICQLAKNGFKASFLDAETKSAFVQKVDDYLAAHA